MEKLILIFLLYSAYYNFSFSVRATTVKNALRITGGVCQTPGEFSCSGIDTRRQRNSNLFQKLGRNILEAQWPHKWIPASRNRGCENYGLFNGYQWIDPKQPPAISLLFDVRGTVAGMQFWMPYSEVRMPGQNYKYNSQPMIQNTTIFGQDYYYITVYFMDPELICTKGRSFRKLEKFGTVSKLYIQHGPTPFHSREVPLTREIALRKGWEDNNCFRGMGWHTFYDHSTWDSDGCTSFQPLLPYYDHNGDMNGFAFFVIGKASSPMLERPALWLTEWISGKFNSTEATPKCVRQVDEAFGFSGLHVYLTERPYEFSCDVNHEFSRLNENIIGTLVYKGKVVKTGVSSMNFNGRTLVSPLQSSFCLIYKELLQGYNFW